MLRYSFAASLAIAVVIFAQSDAMAQSYDWSDQLSGFRTVKSSTTAYGFVHGGSTMGITVDASGKGTNWLTVKVQYHDGFGWLTLEELVIPNGCERTGEFFVPSGEDIRFRFSRSVGTRKINYDVITWVK